MHSNRTAGEAVEALAGGQRSGVHGHRHVALRRGIVPEFAVGVVTPGGHSAVRAERQAVDSACRDGHRYLAVQR